MSDITDRERSLLDIIDGMTPLCPYLFRCPAEGAHGPQTCAGGCHDEPCTTGGPYPIFEHPDLAEAVAVSLVSSTLDNFNIPNDHPAVAWWKEHTGEDLLA